MKRRSKASINSKEGLLEVQRDVSAAGMHQFSLPWIFYFIFSYYSPYIFCLEIFFFMGKPAKSGTLTWQWANVPFPTLPLPLV